jgi:hypothetical protein
MTSFAFGPTRSTAETIAMNEPNLIAEYLTDTARDLAGKLFVAKDTATRLRNLATVESNNVQAAREELARFADAVREYAEENSLDDDFDDVLIRFGFEPRERDYTVSVYRDVSYREEASISVRARNEDAARDKARDRDYGGDVSYDIDYDSYDYGSMEIDGVEED